MNGIVFDIKEFALGDGDGIRTTVFLKGCPLRCIWCHNPEGLSAMPELYVKKSACVGCGLCTRGCTHEDCKPFGRCLHICPQDLVTVSGYSIDHEQLASRLLATADTLTSLGGGVTVSGGEPMMQADFTYMLLSILHGKVHTAIETSGYTDESTFKRITDKADLVIMDLKLASDEEHRRYTGVSNAPILKNLAILKQSGKKHILRTPLIPGITDTDENLRAIAILAGDSRVELLPYNRLAGAKYKSVGRTFTDLIDEDAVRVPDISFFKNAVLK